MYTWVIMGVYMRMQYVHVQIQYVNVSVYVYVYVSPPVDVGGWGQGVGGPWTRDTGSYLHNHHRFPRVVYHWGLVYNHHECMHAYTHTSMYMYILRDLDQWCCGTLRRQDVMVKKKTGIILKLTEAFRSVSSCDCTIYTYCYISSRLDS